MKKFLLNTVMIFAIISFGAFLLAMGSIIGKLQFEHKIKVPEPSILSLKLEGIIGEPSRFLEDLRYFRKDENVKGIVIHINSPGGVVGPSQEIYAEIKRTRDGFQKPVVAVCSAVAASGAYYAAVAADRIVTNPGTMLGSIGVIMQFANLEKLYEWAKVGRYVVKTGAYKDSGASYRPMREDEKELFQDLIDEVQVQFKQAVASGRNLPADLVDKYADGRVFTGEAAVKLGFADKVGTYLDGVRVAGELSGLGDDPEIFEPPEKHASFFETMVEGQFQGSLANRVEGWLSLNLVGKPLYLLPGSLGN